MRPLLSLEAARLARCETRMLAGARTGLVAARRDRDAMAAGLPIELRSRLRVVPLFHRAPPAGGGAEPPPREPPERPLLVLTGNLGYFPTADGARWFLDRVWPLLRGRRPAARLLLAGARPGRALAAAAARAGAELLPAPPDLSAVLARAAVALAPLRAGSGVPIKILEAWAAGVPVVASPWAAAGTSGEGGRDLLVADEPGQWVAALESLLDRPDLRRRLAGAGRRRLADDYSPSAVERRLLAALLEGPDPGA
jgi:glycosyltransferase involved in cell wall biosynthesis